MQDSLETERLMGLRPTGDKSILADLALVYQNPLAMETLSEDGLPFADYTIRLLRDRWMQLWEKQRYGPRLFYDRETAEFIGYCGLRPYELEGITETELLFGLRPEFWRKGYGTEMARACVQEGFDKLNLHSVIGFTLDRNLGSQGVMKAIGMSFVGDITHANMPHVLYRIERILSS